MEAVIIVNSNGEACRGADVVVSSEINSRNTKFVVVANTAHSAAGKEYNGSHAVGSFCNAKGKDNIHTPLYIEIRNIPPCEVIVLMKVYE
jgi:hypothetical protein